MFYNARLDKKGLETILERIPSFKHPKRYLEQYVTSSDLAAELLWQAYLHGDILGKTLVDLGCGTLRLAIGSLILGASRVLGIDVDCDTIREAIDANLDMVRSFSHRITLLCSDARDVRLNNVDTVIMNPPFGVYKRNRGIDILFLRKAMDIARSIYSVHKYSPGLSKIINMLSNDLGYRIISEIRGELAIPMTFGTHTRRIYRVKVVIYIFRKS